MEWAEMDVTTNAVSKVARNTNRLILLRKLSRGSGKANLNLLTGPSRSWVKIELPRVVFIMLFVLTYVT